MAAQAHGRWVADGTELRRDGIEAARFTDPTEAHVAAYLLTNGVEIANTLLRLACELNDHKRLSRELMATHPDYAPRER